MIFGVWLSHGSECPVFMGLVSFFMVVVLCYFSLLSQPENSLSIASAYQQAYHAPSPPASEL